MLPEKETERRGVGRIDREHPIGGEMSDILRGILGRARLPWLLAHHSHVAVLAVFSFINGCLSIGLMSAASVLTHSPFIFPSLGPTAFLFFYTPTAPSASPRNTFIGHAVGAGAGYLSLVVTGLTMAGPALSVGVTWPRVIAAAFSLGLTAGVMVRLAGAAPACGSNHADHLTWPLDATLATDLTHGAVVVLTLQALVINRLAGIPYPLWSPPRQSTEGVEGSGSANRRL